MTIALPGYLPVFDNRVYSRDGSVEGVGGPIPVRNFILLSRYAEPTQQGVINYIRERVRSVEGRATLILPGNIKTEGQKPIDKLILKFSDNVRKDILSHADCEGFLRTHTPASKIEDGQEPDVYCAVGYGMLPVALVEANRQKERITDASWYEEAFINKGVQQAGFGEEWIMRLLVQGDKLPDRSVIGVLLKNMTYGSRTFRMSRRNYDVEGVGSIVDDLYSGIGCPDDFAELEDVSQKTLEMAAMQPLVDLLGDLQAQRIESAIRDRMRVGEQRRPI